MIFTKINLSDEQCPYLETVSKFGNFAECVLTLVWSLAKSGNLFQFPIQVTSIETIEKITFLIDKHQLLASGLNR